MAKKYYAVRKGRAPGIYESWETCKKEVMGFAGAEYKGFMTMEEAKDFLKGLSAGIQEKKSSCAVQAYCDGSFDVKTKRFSYGVVMIKDGQELTFSKAFSDPELSAMRNVAGEIKGAEFVMEYCVAHGIPSVEIFYDYEGIEKWCTGAWKTNKTGTVQYRAFYDSLQGRLNVRFTKVKGHSGDHYNDMADGLAKDALGISH